MIEEMSCSYGTVRTTGVRIRHQVSRRPTQRSQQLQNLTILTVKFHSILNALPWLQVFSGACENALAESERTLHSSRGGWAHLEVLGSTGEGYRWVWEVCVWLPDQITFFWYASAWVGDCSAWVLTIERYILAYLQNFFSVQNCVD
jgi:hypothetical protein